MEFFILYYLMGIIMLPGIIFAAVAQAKIYSAYHEYSEIQTKKQKKAKDVAREVLDKNGLQDISIQKISGNLTDNFNPKTGIVSLSEKVYEGTDVSSVSIALHEVGHAIQHSQNYKPAKIRLLMVPVLNVFSQMLWPLIIIGLIISFFAGFDNTVGQIFIGLGIGFFALSMIFSLITLPTELDASKRAKQELLATQNMDEEEIEGAKKVLSAAAMTYVASLLVSILTLLRFVLTILILKNGDRRWSVEKWKTFVDNF